MPADRGWTNPELRRLCVLVLEQAQEDPDAWASVASRLARMCRWRGHLLAELGRELERASERTLIAV